jgi:hypothetical protein
VRSATLTLAAVVGLGLLVQAQLWQEERGDPQRAALAIHAQAPSQVWLSLGTRRQAGLFTVRTDAQAIELDLPADWTRLEVREVPLSSVSNQDIGRSQRQWHIPAHAEVLFEISRLPASGTLHLAQPVPVHLSWQRIDLLTNTTTHRDQLLLHDVLVLWEDPSTPQP